MGFWRWLERTAQVRALEKTRDMLADANRNLHAQLEARDAHIAKLEAILRDSPARDEIIEHIVSETASRMAPLAQRADGTPICGECGQITPSVARQLQGFLHP